MLVLTRRPGETVMIAPEQGLGTDLCPGFTRPIEVRVLKIEGNRVRLGIDAVAGLRIWREEREEWGPGG